MKNYRIPIFVPHLGCPHDCVFCNQKHITGKTADVTAEDVIKIINEYLEFIPKNSYTEIAFFGGSFTGIDFDKQTELLKIASKFVDEGKVQGIRCSTRPDCINEKILDNLKKHNVTCVELGVQSTDDEVLKLSARGHSFEDVKMASSMIKSYGISLGLQMMLGLPGDNFEKMQKTADDLISLEPTCVRIYPTLVVEDTALCDMYKNGKYLPLSLEDAVNWISVLIPKFKKADIDIIRIGLQTTDEINEETVIGPYHPSIRELAESKIILNVIESFLDKNDVKSQIDIVCNPKIVSLVVGQNKCNLIYLKSKFYVSIIQDECISTDKLKICSKIVDIYK